MLKIMHLVALPLLAYSLLIVAGGKEIDFATHSGYFVSNQFEPNAPTSFVVVQDPSAFDRVFGVAMVMGDSSQRLPINAFVSRMVVAVIHRGKAMVNYRVENVTAEGKTLVVRYTTNSIRSDTAEYACPLVLSLAKGEYDDVQFVENGQKIKRVATRASKKLDAGK
jgi:hypothetical protein